MSYLDTKNPFYEVKFSVIYVKISAKKIAFIYILFLKLMSALAT